jgi:leucyl aminopeptidase
MSGGDAMCPGDIIRISNGKTVEVLNTDAEGHLILADALVYAQRYKPQGIIDIATLTGACVIALGSHATGMMGTSEELKRALKAAGDAVHERVWELPLFAEYAKALKSTVADLKNVGPRWGGAITAASFLSNFVGDVPWVHLDVAGTAILDEATDYAPKGGSGVGVRLLVEFLRNVKAE